jgi:hypothetical protein
MTRSHRVTVRDDNGRAKIHLIDDEGSVVGIASIAWHEYEREARRVLGILVAGARETISAQLSALLYENAVRASENSAELAIKRLTELGMNQAMIDIFADHLAKAVAQKMVEHMPTHR